jgi:protoporphyrinogen oxidase
MQPREKSVAIIGGGPTGLSCALEFSKKGIDFTLFEQENVLGGRIRDTIIDGTSFPLGARTLHDDMLGTLSELGISGLARKAEATTKPAIFYRGRMMVLGTTALLFNRSLSIRTKIDLARFGRFLSRLTPEIASKIPNVPLKDYILGHYSDGLYDDFIQPYSIAELGGTADTISAPRGLRRISSAFKSGYELNGGLSVLVRAIEERISDKVSKSQNVVGITFSDSNFRVSTSEQTKQFETVVCCIPIPEIRKIAQEVSLPSVSYISRWVYVVKGKMRYPKISAILVGDRDLNINYVIRCGDGAVIASLSSKVDPSPFFSSYEIVQSHNWIYDNSRLSQDEKRPPFTTNVPNFYVAGDYIYGGGVGASFRAGRDIANLVSTSARE